MDGSEIVWSVETHEHRERTADWYWGLGLLTVLGAAASIYFSNILLAIILVLGAGSIGYLAARGPRQHTVKINKKGVTLDGTLYPFAAIQSFWVGIEEIPEEYAEFDLAPRTQLFLTTTGFLHPHLTVPLDSVAHAEQVRDFLLQFADEEEQHPHFGEHIAELFGL